MPTITQGCFAALLLATSALPARAQAPGDVAAAPPAHVDYYRGNIGHTGVATERLAAPLSLLWRHTSGAARGNPASPVFAGGTVFYASGGSLLALNAGDGTTKWQYPAGGKAMTFFGATPALAGGALYVTDDSGQAYRIDAATGKAVWTAKIGGALRSAPVVSGNAVLFGSGNNHCYALDTGTGQVLWDQATDGAVTTSPTVTGGLAVFSSSDNSVYSLSLRTGRKAWSVAFDADPSLSPVVYDGSTLFVTAGDTVYGLNPSNGTRRSAFKLPAPLSAPPTVSADGVYAITQTNTLFGLTSGGRERWRATLDSAVSAPPLLAGGLLLVPTQPNVLSGYDANSGALTWRYVFQSTATDSQPKAGSVGVFSAPIVAEGTLYVVSDDGSLSAFRQDAPDDIGPQATQLTPAAGASVSATNLTYGAVIVDDGSGINPATVSLSVDGQPDAQARYQASLNAVFNTPKTPLKDGAHELTVKATDWRGNATTQSWSFTVGSDAGAGAGGQPGFNPNDPNYPGRGGNNPQAPPPPPPITPF
jgi:outer membrane protein assembly factor BamB